MPKQQTLHSFFGGGTASVKKKKTNATSTSTEKENNKRSSEAIESKAKSGAMESGHKVAAGNQPPTSKLSPDAKRRRRVIDDSDDDDDEKTVDPAVKTSISKDLDEKSQLKDENRSVCLESSTSTIDAPMDNEDGVGTGSKNTESGQTPKVKVLDAQHQKKKTNASLPYSELCEAFQSVEAITGRLQIQEIITTLFRRCIDSGNPESLYQLLYLCSNSVAPAYECVELGIGDALLLKAIAEAYGSNLKAVKRKYEEDGDLGIVAQNFKSKQRTLGGFFSKGKVATKKQWSCQEILQAFRDIANMKGNQSQKLKTDKIKKLLVHASNNLEPKFVIRQLQGKLRIGLAQSTVLISLAHALTLSVPPKAHLHQEETCVTPEDFPEEARTYADKKVPKEKRLEAAVAIVKKAYSEVPSYDALLDAALTVPLQNLHMECSLTPGVPVAPMLARPTKSVLEVLKRLNGQRFTAEYKYDGGKITGEATH